MFRCTFFWAHSEMVKLSVFALPLRRILLGRTIVCFWGDFLEVFAKDVKISESLGITVCCVQPLPESVYVQYASVCWRNRMGAHASCCHESYSIPGNKSLSATVVSADLGETEKHIKIMKRDGQMCRHPAYAYNILFLSSSPPLYFSFSLFLDSGLSLNSTVLAEETLFSRCVRTMNK